jgi:hypothetical protein
VLLAGTLLSPARRTVASALRVLGLAQLKQFHRYHRVLSQARWSGLAISLLVATFVPDGPLILGVDETLERRRGAKIAAKGIYHDAVRSSHSHFVKASGPRWICLMLLVPIPWAARTWALPFLTALAPSERYARTHQRRHKTLPDWAWQLPLAVRHWWPDRPLVAVADSTYATLPLLARCQHLRNPITFITRLRLDAALYEPAPPRDPHRIGRPRRKGARLPSLAAVAGDPTTVWTQLAVAQWYGLGDLLWRQCVRPRRRRQLQRQRNAVQSPADLRDRRCVRLGKHELRLHCRGPLDKPLHRRIGTKLS